MPTYACSITATHPSVTVDDVMFIIAEDEGWAEHIATQHAVGRWLYKDGYGHHKASIIDITEALRIVMPARVVKQGGRWYSEHH